MLLYKRRIGNGEWCIPMSTTSPLLTPIRLGSYISNKRGIVSSGYPNNEKRDESERVRVFEIADETLSRVFDISSKSKQKLRIKRRN